MKKGIVVDIDGTIADIRKRMSYADDKYGSDDHPKYWEYCNAYIENTDTPVPGAIEWLDKMRSDVNPATLLYVSGRRNTFLYSTLRWMDNHHFPEGEVYLRPVGMHGVAFKLQMIKMLQQVYDMTISIGDMDSDKEIAETLDIDFMRVHPDGWQL